MMTAYFLDDDEKARINMSEGWPVVCEVIRDEEMIHYTVCTGYIDGDRGDGRVIWSKIVSFGNSPRNRAGGAEFKAAAQEQECVAAAVVAYLKEKK